MARPQRNKVEYFPHPVKHSKKMSYLEKKYGNDGYAVWFKILEELGNTDYHYLNLSDEVQVMFLSDRCMVSEDLLESIIDDLIRLREFDEKLWVENRILFNEKFVESIKDAYKKRLNECINKKSLFILLESLGIRKPSKSNHKPSKSESEGSVKPQSKEEYTKEKKNTPKPPKGDSSENSNSKNPKIDWELLLQKFNEITGKKARVVPDKAKRQIRARLKEGYSRQQILIAIKNCSQDPYHIENPKFLTLEFISRSDKFEKYVQSIPQTSKSSNQNNNTTSRIPIG